MIEINFKDAVHFNWGFQGALQGTATLNQTGIDAFLLIAVGNNSAWFIDPLSTPTSLTVMERAEFDILIAELILLGGMMFCMNDQIYANKP